MAVHGGEEKHLAGGVETRMTEIKCFVGSSEVTVWLFLCSKS